MPLAPAGWPVALDAAYYPLDLLGQGATARVWRVRERATGTEVALKLVRAERGHEPLVREGLCNEYLTLLQLRGTGCLEPRGFGRLGELPYYAMELATGDGLDARLPMTPERVEEILSQLLEALERVHARGWAHGDLKPENVRLDESGRVRLLDLGLASPLESMPVGPRGTPAYMAPEVARSMRVDRRSDLYAVGAIAHALLTGAPPFTAPTVLELFRLHATAPPPELPPTVPPRLRRLVASLLAKSPFERPASATAARRLLGHDLPVVPELIEPALVGHEAVLEQLLAPPLAPTLMTLGGPAGSGKTKLLHVLEAREQVAGRPVLRCALPPCSEPHGSLQGLGRALAALVAGHEPARAAACQEALRRADELEGRPRLARLEASWCELVQAAAPDGLRILLDDWDLADPASHELVHELARRCPEVGWLAATREPGQVNVPALSAPELGRLAAQALGQDEVAPSFARQLLQRSAGNPGGALRLLGRLVGEGQLRREGERWRTDHVQVPAAEEPTRAGLQPLDDLPPAARTLAATLGLLTQPLELAPLSDLMGGPDATAEALGVLRTRGLLQRGMAQPWLAGPSVRAAAAAWLTPAERAARHARLAALFPEEAPARVHHLRHAGELALAWPAALAAARRLLADYALGPAQELASWLALEEAAPAPLRAGAAEVRGDVHRMRGELELARDRYLEAQTLAAAGPRLLVSLALVRQMRSEFEEACQLAAAGAQAARDAEAPREAARALTTLARCHHLMGQTAPAQAAAEAALVAARQGAARDFEAEALGLLGLFATTCGPRPEEGLPLLAASLALREQLGDRIGLNDAHGLLGNALVALGRLDEARRSFERNLELCRELGAAHSDEITAQLNLAQLELACGAPDRARALAAAAATMAAAEGDRFLLGYARGLAGRVQAELGCLAAAREDLGAARAIANELDSAYLQLALDAWQAPVERLLGRPLRALELAREGLARAEASGLPEFTASLQETVGQSLLDLDEPEAATALLATGLAQARVRSDDASIARLALAQARLDPSYLELARTSATRAGLAGVLLAVAIQESSAGPASRTLLEELGQRALTRGLVWVTLEALTHQAVLDPQAARAREDLLARLGRDLAVAEQARLWRHHGQAAAPLAPAGPANLIAEFGRLVTSSLHYREVLDQVIDRVMALTGADRGMIMLVEADGGLSGLVTRPRTQEATPQLMAFSRTFVETVRRERRGLWVADAQEDERFRMADSILAMDLRTVLCVPLIVDEALIGLLYVDRQSINASFTAADLELVEGLSGFAGLAIANARRYEEARDLASRLEALQELARVGMAAPDPGTLLQGWLAMACRLAAAERGTFLAAGGEGLLPGAGPPDRELQELAARACAMDQTLLGRVGHASAVAVPLACPAPGPASLVLLRAQEALPFSPAEQEALEALGCQGSLAWLALAARRPRQLMDRAALLQALEANAGELLVLSLGDLGALATRCGAATAVQVRDQLGQEAMALAPAAVAGWLAEGILGLTEGEGDRLAAHLGLMTVCDAAGQEVWRPEIRWRQVTRSGLPVRDWVNRGLKALEAPAAATDAPDP